MVIHPYKYDKYKYTNMISQCQTNKKLSVGNESAQTDGQTYGQSDSYILPWTSFTRGITTNMYKQKYYCTKVSFFCLYILAVHIWCNVYQVDLTNSYKCMSDWNESFPFNYLDIVLFNEHLVDWPDRDTKHDIHCLYDTGSLVVECVGILELNALVGSRYLFTRSGPTKTRTEIYVGFNIK